MTESTPSSRHCNVPLAESGETLLLAPSVLLHVVVQLVQLGAADLGLRYFKYYLAVLK